MENRLTHIVHTEFFQENTLSLTEDRKTLRIKKKEYLLSSFLVAYLKNIYPERDICWQFSSLKEDREEGFDIYLRIGNTHNIPVDITTNKEKMIETKWVETLIFYTSEEVWKRILKSTKENPIREKKDIERLAHSWIALYSPWVPEVVLVRNKKIIEMEQILLEENPQIKEQKEIKIDEYTEDMYEISSGNIANLLVYRFVQLKNWIFRILR